MGACKRARRHIESSFLPQRAAGAKLALFGSLVFSASGCTAAGELEPTSVTTDPAAGGVAGQRPSSAPGQAPSPSPSSPALVLDPGKTASPVGLLPGDTADENAGGARSGVDALDDIRDAGADASDARDDRDAAPSDGDGGGSRRDAGAETGVDASVAPSGGDASPPNELDASPSRPSVPCPGVVFEGSCYEFFDEQTSWREAEARCAAWGGHLASVESSEEDAFIGAWPALSGVPLLDGSGIWLGGTDALRDGNFRWSDDRALSFVGWAPDQPNNGVGVDCIEKRNDATQSWYDRRCTDGERYVCERPE
jgi:hypothetical protein